jgi:hypothetical protein
MYAFKIRRSIERYVNATAELQTSASVFIPTSYQDLAGILLRTPVPPRGTQSPASGVRAKPC